MKLGPGNDHWPLRAPCAPTLTQVSTPPVRRFSQSPCLRWLMSKLGMMVSEINKQRKYERGNWKEPGKTRAKEWWMCTLATHRGIFLRLRNRPGTVTEKKRFGVDNRLYSVTPGTRILRFTVKKFITEMKP